MLKFIVTRIALGLLSLLAVTLLIFAATEILPGDVASAVLGQGATPETLADRKSTRLNSSHVSQSRMPSSA